MDTERKRIALVEDHVNTRLLVRAVLEANYELSEYGTGTDAIEGFGHHRPDLILMDISLPGISGVDVLRRVRETPTLREIPVIALTAHAMAGDREKLLEEGFDEYLTKPIVDIQEFVAIIARVLSYTLT